MCQIATIKLTAKQFKQMQANDSDLQRYCETSKWSQEEVPGNAIFVVQSGMIYQKYKAREEHAEDIIQLIVPTELREVTKYVHSSLLGAYMGIHNVSHQDYHLLPNFVTITLLSKSTCCML